MTMTTDYETFKASIIAHVSSHMKGNDPSHDIDHVRRVVDLALKIATTSPEMSSIDLQIVEIAAWCHDIDDRKYKKKQQDDSQKVSLQSLLETYFSPEKTTQITTIISTISFSYELKSPDTIYSPEAKCVMDADRLDAIGAVGIARTFAFGATRLTRFLYVKEDVPIIMNTETMKSIMNTWPDIHHEAYKKKSELKDLNNEEEDTNSVVKHFFDKLLRLYLMMKTELGKEMAVQRTEYMKGFLEQLAREVAV